MCLRSLISRSAILLAVLTGSAFAADCVSFTEARKHIGKTHCVVGTVLHVKDGSRGMTFLDFCEDYRVCPFTVVVFASDLKHVGDVRQLKGRAVEIKGTIVDYDGRAEIILRHPQQLGKGAAFLPPLPKDYDVERKGRFSAGKFSHPKGGKKQTRKKGQAVGIEDPEDP
jgi:hypothetical protein